MQFDKLQVNSLKNDGNLSSTQGTTNHSEHSISYGTLTGNHHIYILPSELGNSPNLHISGHLAGFTLSIKLLEGTEPEWDPVVLDGCELMITLHDGTPSGGVFKTYWDTFLGPITLDVSGTATQQEHGLMVNWFNGICQSTHMYYNV